MTRQSLVPSCAVIAASLVMLTACADVSDRSEGAFTVQTVPLESGNPEARRIELRHGSRVLARQVSGVSVDPRRPGRVIFAARDPGACGTFFFDSDGEHRWRMSRWLMSVHPREDLPAHAAVPSPWSPDGRRVFAGNAIGRPVVFDLQQQTAIAIRDLLLTDGRFIDAHATLWSPDGHQLAIEIRVNGHDEHGRPEGRRGRDLATVTLNAAPMVQYVASLARSAPIWTDLEYHWADGRLVVEPSPAEGGLVVREPADLLWQPAAAPPTSPTITVTDGNCP